MNSKIFRVNKICKRNCQYSKFIKPSEININFNQVEIKIGSVELNGVTTKCVNLAIQIDNFYVS